MISPKQGRELQCLAKLQERAVTGVLPALLADAITFREALVNDKRSAHYEEREIAELYDLLDLVTGKV